MSRHRSDRAIPLAARRDGCMLMEELPCVAPPLEAVSLARDQYLARAILEDDAHALNCAYHAHVAVDDHVRLENVDITRTETAEHFVEHRERRLNTAGRKWRNVEPQRILGPVLRALCSGHRFAHLFDDLDERGPVFLGGVAVLCAHGRVLV